jgi:sugar phosphate isomerase/epimerase
MMERRMFLKVATLGALAYACPYDGLGQEKPQKFKIGMAATTWLATNPSTAEYWKAVEGIAQLGIGATEADNSAARLDSAYGADPAAFVTRSRGIGVQLEGVYQALPLHEPKSWDAIMTKIRSDGKFLKAASAKYIALGWAPPHPVGGKPYQRTAADVQQVIRAADEIGKISSEEYGIIVALHAERDIPKDVVIEILDGTNPKYLKFCADVGHLAGMGLDPLPTVKKYASRLAVSHWKDFDPNFSSPSYLGAKAKGDFVEVGTGTVDFRGLAAFYRQIGFDGWVMIELDRYHKASIMESVRQMKAFVTDQLKLQFVPLQH